MSGVQQNPTAEDVVLSGCRVCVRCGHARKYPEQFHKHSSYRDGRDPICASCRNAQNRHRPERARKISMAEEYRLELESAKREAARVEAANQRAFDRLRATTDDAIARRAS